MSLTIAFLGAKDIGAFCLQYLLDSASALDYEVVCVRTRRGAAGEKIETIARNGGILLLDNLEDLPKVDIIISVQHHELLKQKDIDKARKIAVNLHLAPLPEYRGCNQFSFAIMDDAQEFGVTFHQMDSRIDHGAILYEKRFPVPANSWVKDLQELSVRNGEKLFEESLSDLVSGNFVLRPQPEIKNRKPGRLYFRKEIEQIKEIPLDLPKTEIEKRIRATSMPGFEPPYCRIGGKKVYFETE